ncbi:MAG: CHAT domain-containing protein [Thermosynechococcaceae cyanobacterium MS004]|nr:CHAT domain-containing protein [Thermosynechococcaceae cyanobacterium MS004]
MSIFAILGLTNILSIAPNSLPVERVDLIQNSILVDSKHNKLKITQQDVEAQPTKKLNINEVIDTVKERANKNHAEGNFKKEADDLVGLGRLYALKGETRKGLSFIQSALEIHRRIDSPWSKCFTLNALGDSYKELGEYKKALESYKQSISISQNFDKTKDNYFSLIAGIQGIASAYYDLGEIKEAFAGYERIVEISKQYGYRKEQARWLESIGNLYMSIGDFRKALDYINQSIELNRFAQNEDELYPNRVKSEPPYALKKSMENFLSPNIKVDSSVKKSDTQVQSTDKAQMDLLLKTWEQNAKNSRSDGDLRGELLAIGVTSMIYQGNRNYPKMYETSKRKLEIQRSFESPVGESDALFEIANIFNAWDRKQEALNYYNLALEKQRQIGVRLKEAQTLDAMGDLYQSMGAYQLSLVSYNMALALYRNRGFLSNQNIVLGSIVRVHTLMDNPVQGLDVAQNQLLPLAELTGNRFLKISALYTIADIHRRLGDHENALKALNDSQSQDLLGAGDEDDTYRSYALFRFGATYQAMKDFSKAQEALEKSVDLSRKLGIKEDEARRLSELGKLYDDWQKPVEAQKAYEQALPLFQKLKFRLDEADTLWLIANSKRKQGDLDSALKQIEAAIKIIEDIRQDVSSSELRTSFLASRQGYYKIKIRILMELHKQQPSKGYDALALETSERSRARTLLDLLTESRVNIRQGVSPQLLDREQTLLRQLTAVEKRRAELVTNQVNSAERTALDQETSALLAQYKEAQAQIKSNSPRYAALTQPQPLTLKQIQQQVLDDDTILLEYSLGEEQSYLWAVTKAGITSYVLPNRAEIERASKRFNSQIANSNNVKSLGEISESVAFSKMLLGSVADQLGQKRLVIVSDGALQFTPFSALPNPSSTDSSSPIPLVINHEIIHLPSASTLSLIRQDLKDRKPAAKSIAIFANPIFSSNDPRVAQKPTLIAATPSPSSNLDLKLIEQKNLQQSAKDRGISLVALPGTQQEADQILKLLPDPDHYTAFDLNANKANATSPSLAQYRIVHFATHGILDTTNPERSSIALSLVDAQGKPQDGFLRLNDIFNLNLPAELVVLSACQTGSGKEVRGEGLVGLTRGFMYAGAPRVLVSLWNVSDESTPELMTVFYEAMLKRNLPPAAALRAAQIQLWKSQKWQAPYHWAAFTLQGEWRP